MTIVLNPQVLHLSIGDYITMTTVQSPQVILFFIGDYITMTTCEELGAPVFTSSCLSCTVIQYVDFHNNTSSVCHLTSLSCVCPTTPFIQTYESDRDLCVQHLHSSRRMSQTGTCVSNNSNHPDGSVRQGPVWERSQYLKT